MAASTTVVVRHRQPLINDDDSSLESMNAAHTHKYLNVLHDI